VIALALGTNALLRKTNPYGQTPHILVLRDDPSCLANTYYAAQVTRFTDWANLDLTSEGVPDDEDLFTYACGQIEDVGHHYSPPIDARFNKWLRYFIAYNLWDTEVGRYPYVDPFNPPFWFEFMGVNMTYEAGPGPDFPDEVLPGAALIQSIFRGIGVALSSNITNAQGFYVDSLTVVQLNDMETFPTEQNNMFIKIQKSLTSIDYRTIANAGTRTGPVTYWMVMSFMRQVAFPKTIITKAIENPPAFMVVRFALGCSGPDYFFGTNYCTNCIEGTTCTAV